MLNNLKLFCMGASAMMRTVNPYTFQIVWVSGAAQLDKLMCFAIEMVAKRCELFMNFIE